MKNSNSKLNNALDILGTKWTLPIVAAILDNKNRFNEIQRECKVCPRTLSARLYELEKNGIINKTNIRNKTSKVEYSLTKKGESLSSVIAAISDWSYKN